jgi:hypothetical protein
MSINAMGLMIGPSEILNRIGRDSFAKYAFIVPDWGGKIQPGIQAKALSLLNLYDGVQYETVFNEKYKCHMLFVFRSEDEKCAVQNFASSLPEANVWRD